MKIKVLLALMAIALSSCSSSHKSDIPDGVAYVTCYDVNKKQISQNRVEGYAIIRIYKRSTHPNTIGHKCIVEAFEYKENQNVTK